MVHIGLVKFFFKFVGRANRLDFPIDHDGNSVAIFGFVHIVGRHEDGDATTGGIVDEFPKLAARRRIDTPRGLIEEHHAGLVENRHRKRQFLLPTERQRNHQVVFVVFKLQLTQQLVGFPPDFIVFHPINTCEEADVLGDGEVFVEREPLRHIANVPLDLLVFGANVVAHYPARSARRLVQSREHVHRGGFSGSVSTEETENLAFFHRKTDVIDRVERAESLDEMLHFDDVFFLACCSILNIVGGEAFRIENLGKFRKNHLWRTDSLHLSVVEKRHALATSHLVEIGCRSDDGDVALFQHSEHFPEFLAADGIDARRGFVEEEHTRLMHQRTTQCQFLFHTARKSPCATIFEAFNLLINGLDGIVALVDGRAEKCGEKLQVFLDRQILIEREFSRHIAHSTTHVAHLSDHVEPIDRGRACVGQEQRTKNAKHRGLASAVGADESENLALPHAERHIVECHHAPVTLADIFYLNRIHFFTPHFTLHTPHSSLHKTPPYIPIFTNPSFLMAIFTAYTKSARSSSVRMVLGVNSLRLEIHRTTPPYSFRSPSP